MAGSGRSPFFPRPDAQTRKEALAAAGPSWREWFYYDFLRHWAALGFLVVDVWVALTFYFLPLPLAGVPASLAAAIYLEFLAYRWLWYRPEPGSRGSAAEFRRTWLRPREFGRWTPENDRARSGMAPFPRAGPDPREFL